MQSPRPPTRSQHATEVDESDFHLPSTDDDTRLMRFMAGVVFVILGLMAFGLIAFVVW